MKRHKNYVANGRLLEKAPDMYNMLAYLKDYLRCLSTRTGLYEELKQKADDVKRLLEKIDGK